MKERDLKKYTGYMRESAQFTGEGHSAVRERAAAWMARDQATRLAFQKEFANGATVAEAEQRVLGVR